jgi:hypothetical protein
VNHHNGHRLATLQYRTVRIDQLSINLVWLEMWITDTNRLYYQILYSVTKMNGHDLE